MHPAFNSRVRGRAVRDFDHGLKRHQDSRQRREDDQSDLLRSLEAPAVQQRGAAHGYVDDSADPGVVSMQAEAVLGRPAPQLRRDHAEVPEGQQRPAGEYGQRSDLGSLLHGTSPPGRKSSHHLALRKCAHDCAHGQVVGSEQRESLLCRLLLLHAHPLRDCGRSEEGHSVGYFRSCVVTVSVYIAWFLAFLTSTAYLPFSQDVGFHRISSTASSSTRGAFPRSELRDDSPTRPSAYKFYYREDDPEEDREILPAYRKGRRENVWLTAFVDFFEFFIATPKDFDKAAELGVKLYEDHKGLPPCDFDRWQKGHVGCYIPHGEKRAYRVTVVGSLHEDETGEAMLSVRYADYGTKANVSYRDVVPLRQAYKTHALCFRCSLEDFTELEEDEMFDLRKTAKKMKDLEVVIEPQERRWEERLTIVKLRFTPPGANREYVYPDDLYRKHLCAAPDHRD